MSQPDDVEEERVRLTALVADIEARLRKANAELATLPKRTAGRPKGLKILSPTADHNHRAAREALNLLQKFENNQRRKGLSLRLPKAEKERIISAARKIFPKSSEERVLDLFNRHRKWDEKKRTPRGYVLRLRGPDYL